MCKANKKYSQKNSQRHQKPVPASKIASHNSSMPKKQKSKTPQIPTPDMAPKTVDTTEKSVHTSKNVAADDSTQRYLPFGEIRDNVMYMKDGSARIILAVQPVNFSLKSEQEQDAIIYSYQRFLNSLRFPVQILVRSLKVDIE